MTLPITTERLILRRYTQADIQDVVAFAAHPSVASATPDFEATESGVKAYIDLQNSYQPFEKGKCFDLAIELKEKSKVIGLLSLVCNDDKQGEIGYALGVEYRGRGLATESTAALMEYGFTTLGLHRIQAETDSSNPRSWQLMQRVGMKREGRLREAKFSDDKWFDKLIYGILGEEWQAMRAGRESSVNGQEKI
jgi:RimJ/RimL family protein N-acetyltransferase